MAVEKQNHRYSRETFFYTPGGNIRTTPHGRIATLSLIGIPSTIFACERLRVNDELKLHKPLYLGEKVVHKTGPNLGAYTILKFERSESSVIATIFNGNHTEQCDVQDLKSSFSRTLGPIKTRSLDVLMPNVQAIGMQVETGDLSEEFHILALQNENKKMLLSIGLKISATEIDENNEVAGIVTRIIYANRLYPGYPYTAEVLSDGKIYTVDAAAAKLTPVALRGIRSIT
ncbi:hypothetical protein HGB07_03690 [Candidatus Roizmanbacteria bacterium]|nr:hypothetical protein [Candidatus Roizmanbacteria bacterium]